MWILIIIKKNKLRFRWAACKQCAWDTSLTFLPHHLPVNSVLDLWATCPWRQTDANKRIDALISDPKYLFWWPELEKIAIFLFPLFHAPPPFFKKGLFSSRCRVTGWDRSDVKGAQDHLPMHPTRLLLECCGRLIQSEHSGRKTEMGSMRGWSGGLWNRSRDPSQLG